MQQWSRQICLAPGACFYRHYFPFFFKIKVQQITLPDCCPEKTAFFLSHCLCLHSFSSPYLLPLLTPSSNPYSFLCNQQFLSLKLCKCALCVCACVCVPSTSWYPSAQYLLSSRAFIFSLFLLEVTQHPFKSSETTLLHNYK